METGGAASAISVLVPALNEEAPIAEVVRECLQADADGAGGRVAEVIVVDNGSTDATADRARSAGARVVSQPNRGYGRACAAGVAALGPDCRVVVFLDGDGSDVAAEMARLTLPVLAGERDFVIGSRVRGEREPGSMNHTQLFAGWMAGVLMRVRYGVRYTDMCPFRAVRRDALDRLGMREETYGWNLEMQMRAAATGLRIAEVPVPHRCRTGGESKVSGNLRASLVAAGRIGQTFLRVAAGAK